MGKILSVFILCLLINSYAYSTSITDELSKLNDLYKEGAITEEEFSRAKFILLNDETEKIMDLDSIKALIDKSLEQTNENLTTNEDNLEINKTLDTSGLTLSEEDALKAQIFTCWSVPIGLPYGNDLTVRVKLTLNSDGSIKKLKMLDYVKMNSPGNESFRTLADSVRRAIQLCNPLKVPESSYHRWKELILNFDARDMLG